MDGFDDYLDPIIKDGRNASILTNVLGGVAIASALAAGTVLIIDLASPPEKAGKTSFAPQVTPDFTGFAFEMTF